MRKNLLLGIVLGIFSLFPISLFAYPTSYTSGSGYLDYSYAGLGNADEVLAFAEYNGSLSVGTAIEYTLRGEYANYVERVRLWIRPYESSTTTNQSSVPATYAFPFDSRRPAQDFGIYNTTTGETETVASGAELIAETTDLTLTSLASTISKESGQYVIYLTADIKSEDEVSLTLSEIWDTDNYTKIGGNITKVNGTEISTSALSGYEAGSRVLVTRRQVLYSPYDFYSRYYRIPCITTTSDGTLIAVSDARKYHAHDIANDIDMLVRRSTDNGKTWSAPVVVAHGQISGSSDAMNHDATIGYGDASIAALPNGKVLLCMVKGNRIAAGTDSDSTWVAYRVSDDNGITWGAEKTIPAALLNNARGCIAPGNMCVVEEGILKGKVLAAFRSASRHDKSGVYHGNIFLIYDPSTGSWTRAYSTYTYTKNNFWGRPETEEDRNRYIYNSYLDYSATESFLGTLNGYTDVTCDDSGVFDNSLAGDDESVIVEVAENTFLVSHRVNSSPYRAFTRLVISETPGVETGIKYTPTKLTSTGFTCTSSTNGSIIKHTDVNGNRFLIHAVPKQNSTYNSRSTRTALTIYTAKYDGSSDAIEWKERVCLTDPFGQINETAQYSSMTRMADGTIGLLFEEYNQSVYSRPGYDGCTLSSSNADFIMRSVFMNVRPGDLIEEWGDEDYIDVLSPVIAPESQTYHSQAGKPRPEVVITNPNEVGTGIITTYDVLYRQTDGTETYLYNGATFSEADLTITWSELAQKMGLEESAEVPNGASLVVTAQCSVESAGKTYVSNEIQCNYIFKNPVRKVMIYARPVTGSGVGNPTIVAGSQTAGPSEIVTVGMDVEVSITAFAATENPMITFSHFAYPVSSTDKEGTEITETEWASAANVQTMAGGRQLVFSMKEESVIPSNYSMDLGNGEQEDVLVFYVFYNSEKAGYKSQVVTSGHALVGGEGYTLLNETNSSALSTNDDVVVGFATAAGTWTNDNTTTYLTEYSDVAESYVDESSSVNYKMVNSIVYPMEYTDLHLNVAVQPDLNTAKYLNAVIMFVQNGQYLCNEDGSYLYALLQGQLQHHDKSDPIYTNATIVAPWYGLNSDGVYAGKVAEQVAGVASVSNLDNENLRGIKFYNMQDRLNTSMTEKPLYVMIFVVSNLVTDIASIVNTSEVATSAMYVHVHGITSAIYPTGVEDVEQDEFVIVNINNGAQFIGNEPVVNVYNAMGVLVESFALNGVHNVELSQGVYIANGKKFIVR